MRNCKKYQNLAIHSQKCSELSPFDNDVAHKKLEKLKPKDIEIFSRKREYSFASADSGESKKVWRKSYLGPRDTVAYLFIGDSRNNTKSANYEAGRVAA